MLCGQSTDPERAQNTFKKIVSQENCTTDEEAFTDIRGCSQNMSAAENGGWKMLTMAEKGGTGG